MVLNMTRISCRAFMLLSYHYKGHIASTFFHFFAASADAGEDLQTTGSTGMIREAYTSPYIYICFAVWHAIKRKVFVDGLLDIFVLFIVCVIILCFALYRLYVYGLLCVLYGIFCYIVCSF